MNAAVPRSGRVLVALSLCAAATLCLAGSHKLVAPPGALDEKTAGASLIEDYGSYRLYRITDGALAALPQAARKEIRLADEMDLIRIDAYPIDTRETAVSIPSHLRATESEAGALHLVQFVGPIKQAWLDALQAVGARPVQYIESNAYLVWADGPAREAIDRLEAKGFLQYSGAYHPYYKLGPTLRGPLSDGPNEERAVPVTIQILAHDGSMATRQRIEAVASSLDSSWQPVLSYENVQATVPLSRIAEIASLPDVTWVGERLPITLNDESQDQIVAGHLNGGGTAPSGPGYKTFLDGKGFSADPAAYPIVGLSDDGVANGSTANGGGDPTFTKLGDGATTRLAFITNCTTNPSGNGVGGHGHINTSIIGGYDVRAGAPYRDTDGYQRGMGVNPYGRMAMTKIFRDTGTFDESGCGGTDAGVIASSYTNGARISSNSWGCSGCAGTYDAASQAYDAGTRDALPGTAGNQEYLFIFSAGNAGPGAATVGTPGNGKNMITAAAGEGVRPTWSDGCGVDPGGADSAMDIIDFSSRGPAPGGRVKPDMTAPGTHIQGTASTDPGYNGASVCDEFQPTGQTIFAASSGTSHSAPALSGTASLYYRWLQGHYLSAVPSPALIKAYMLTHTTYLTGVDAGDTLPSNSQGYGMPNLEMAFDTAQRFLVDQSVLLNNSGESYTFNGAVADPGKPVRVVMVYTDAPGAVGVTPQVNNLDLTVTVGGTTYLGNHFSGQFSVAGGSADTANNAEAVYLPAGASGALSFTVNGFNIAGDGVPNVGDATDQDFAVVCYNCAEFPDFSLGVTPASRSICAPADAVYDIDIGSILGFNEPATLTTNNLPAGASANFTVNPVTPPGTSQLSVSDTGSVAAGAYSFDLIATSATKQHQQALSLNVFSASPSAPTLLTPANGATSQPLRPAFTWSASTQVETYTLEVATDSGFSNVIHTATGLTSAAYTPSSDLPSNTQLYWRVRALNPCGAGANSAAFSFTTLALPGDCPNGSVPSNVYFIDFESGAPGWTSGGTGSTWALSTARSWSATHAYLAADVGSVTDQQLVSPAIALPLGQNPLNLIYYNWQEMESFSTGCFDGGILEVSTSGPAGPWTQLQVQLLTDPYDGTVSSSFMNPLAGKSAWCGDPADWTRSVVDLSAYAGQTVNLRWRLGTDTSASREGWYLDDVRFQSCLAGADFTLVAAPATREVCAGAPASYAITLGQTLGFNEAVTLSTSGLPGGATESYTVNPVTPPGASQLDVGTTGVAFGTYALTTTGTAPSKTHSQGVTLKVFTATAAVPSLLAPAYDATGQPLRPAFSWSAPAQAATYTIEIATDPGFVTIVRSASGLTTASYTPPTDLAPATKHWWRVRVTNACGTSPNSSVFRFTTLALPGDCPVGKVANPLYVINFESGAPGWISSGTGNTWTISTARSFSATHSYFASDPATVSDQRLVSPSVVLPAGQNPLTLVFYTWQLMEPRTGGCYDGGILEISTAGTAGPWTQLQAQLLTDPYDGPISTGFANPLGGLNAWCGPEDWTRSAVDLTAFAGQTVNFRFRLGSDNSDSREGWYIDDVKVTSCQTVAAPSIPPVPDGAFVPGTGVLTSRLSSDGSNLHITWDTTTCSSTSYNLYYGLGTQLPASLGGTYGLSGSLFDIGTNGAAGFDWYGSPSPAGDPSRLLWLLVVSTDSNVREGSWGRDSTGGERKGPGPGGSSGQGPYQTKDTSHASCP